MTDKTTPNTQVFSQGDLENTLEGEQLQSTSALPGAAIEMMGLNKTFTTKDKEVPALEGINARVIAGELVSIIGPSGCGKSTLLRLIAGLEKPSSGSIELQRSTSHRPVGFVFQEAVLLPWKTALENIRFPLDTAGVNRKTADETSRKLIDLVGLAGFETALPKELSGGMKQRAAIARALADDPPILLMDEPFSAVDLLTRENLNDQLSLIWKETKKTIVLVTHSVEEAAYLSSRIIVMSPRPGQILHVIDVDLPFPRNEETKRHTRYVDLVAELRATMRQLTS